MTSRGSLRKKLVVATIAAIAALGMAACASDADSGSSGGPSDVDAAQAVVDEHLVRPTTIPVTEPFEGEIPSGESLIFLSCGAPSCNLQGEIFEEMATKVGWSFEQVNTTGTPESVRAAWDTAVREEPTAVVYTAMDYTQFTEQMQTLQDAGTTVAACCITDDAPVDYNIFDIDFAAEVGAVFADFVTAHSDGDAEVLEVTVSAFPVLQGYTDGYNSEIAKVCPGCSTEELDVSYDALVAGESPNAIVSHLRAHPDTKYVVLNLENLGIGLPAALSAAGLTDITTIGAGPDETTLQYVESGQQAATIPMIPFYEVDGAIFDAILRDVTGQTVPDGLEVDIPIWIVTEDNIPGSEIFPDVEDALDQYYELWGV